MKYVRQRNYYSCGPILLFNLLRWANIIKISYREIFVLTECSMEKGTKTIKFTEALKKIISQNENLKLKKQIIKPSYKQIKQNLKSNNDAIILEYFKNEEYLHFVLLVKYEDEIFVINEGAENKKIPIVQNADLFLKKIFIENEENCHQYPIIWVVVKE